MKCRRYGGAAAGKIGLGLLACASVVAALTAVVPAAGATRVHGRETPRRQETRPAPSSPAARPASSPRAAAEPEITASTSMNSRGAQQISINVAIGGTGIQNALCRRNQDCDIVQALGVPYSDASPTPSPAPQPPPRARAAARARESARGGGAARAREGVRTRQGGRAGAGARTTRDGRPALAERAPSGAARMGAAWGSLGEGL